MTALGRLMQLAGLTIPPLAVIAQLSQSISVGNLLAFLLAAACLFWIGRILEGYGA